MIEPRALTQALNDAGIDPVQFHKDLEESGDAFANQFNRDDPNYHGGNDTAVPTGGTRIPESMGGAAAGDWRELPENQMAIEPEYPPEYHTAMAQYELFGKIKKTISVLNKPVENSYKVRLQYKGAEGDDKTAMESRLKGEENLRDGALNAAQLIFEQLDQAILSDRSKSTVKEVMERGRFPFEDRDTLGDYMTVLQRVNQTLFADQKKLLDKIKKIKKEASSGATTAAAKVDATSGGYGTSPAPVVDAATAGA
jgi:hypothetical protein